jgi:demethylmenaquinone methyltransferase/2-methoxy-6-polyprenyl-1,4-benzoquinol methylase
MSKKKFEVRRRYDATAKHYDPRYTNIQKQKYREVFSHINFSDKELILDVGAGTGLLLDFFEENAQNIFCCDFSINMLKEGRKKHNNGFFICSDIESLPFRENCFDLCTSFSVLQNVQNIHKTIEEKLFVIKNNGILILTALKKKFDKNKLKNIVNTAGFKLNKIWDLSIEDISVIARKSKR